MNWLHPRLYKTGVYCPCKHLLKFKLLFFHTLNMKIWWQLLTAYGQKKHNSYITDRMLHIEQYQRKSKQSVQWMANVWMYLYLNRSIFLSDNIQKDDFSGKRFSSGNWLNETEMLAEPCWTENRRWTRELTWSHSLGSHILLCSYPKRHQYFPSKH